MPTQNLLRLLLLLILMRRIVLATAAYLRPEAYVPNRVNLTYSKSKAWVTAGFTWIVFSVVVSRSISRSRPWWLMVFLSSTSPRSMYVCNSTLVFKRQVRF